MASRQNYIVWLHEITLRIWLGAYASSPIITTWEDCAGSSTVLLILSEGVEIELSDSKVENATLNVEFMRQLVVIVIGGVPTILEVRSVCLFMSVGTILLKCSISPTVFDPRKHQVDLRKDEVGFPQLGNIYPVADEIPPGIHFAPLLELGPSFSLCFRIKLSVVCWFRSHGMGFGLLLLPARPGKKTSMKMWQCDKASSR